MPTYRNALLTLTLLFFCLSVLAETKGSYLDNCKDAVTSKANHEAIEYCEHLLSQASNHELTEEATFIKLELADLYALQENREQSRHLLQQVKTSEAFTLHQVIRYRWYRSIGLDYLHQNLFAEATDYLQQAYEIAQLSENITQLAKSANDLGLVHYKQKNYKDALLYYKESLKLKEEIGNLYYIGTTLNNLGLLNKEHKNYQQAIKYYQQSLDVYLKYTEQEGFDQRVFTNISHLYEDLAVTYSLAGNRELGEVYTRRIIDTFSRKLAQNDKVRAMKNLALVHVEQNQADKAQLFIQEAEHYATGVSKYIAEIDYIKAAIAYLKGDFEQARYLLKQSIPLSKSNDDIVVLERSYDLLHLLDLQDKQFESAIQHLKTAYQYKEKSLESQYESDLRVIQEQIEKERVERRLINEQLKSQQQRSRIQSLSNTLLIISLILVIIAFIAAFIIYRKAKEKQRLLQSIKTHKDKVLLLESEQEGDSDEDKPQTNNKQSPDFRQLLVELLIETLALWEKSTQTDRIELAEKSGIWKVSIDDGRLRTRSLDKYIDINKIPKNPRWRNVVKTSHYVLAECSIKSQERDHLERKLDKVMALIKERSTAQSS
ncbi:tetratricopeptide repeat protein [Kangiella geojedonensis]|uniref:TPR repeat-containing protein n=1 Tax=Kangiella geojedonensis TaxID=914150 RepID=A0A0F6RC96_9GAMM|nr:tetratricopeptide repeat protein [Kangiella geojedonensis]AKE51821.1 TPR repeat-containing protein [Kangiella geojedonensis]